jgi:hypothetical protein
MCSKSRLQRLLSFILFFATASSTPSFSFAKASPSFDVEASKKASTHAPLEREIRADMDFLASDTRDEHLAALFAASQFEALGLEPGGSDGTYIQRAALPNPLPQRTQQRLFGFEDVPRKETWNAIGILRGTDLAAEVILLTAHLDHLGIGPAMGTSNDTIYNGADDDASGTTAVLTLARILASGQRPRRTIVFALFGTEELGGFGNHAFLDHPPVPLSSIVANLEFEMMGRPDPAVPPGTLWLTGYDRSNLGPTLAQHGAHLVNDPHPAQKFFQRSDNYALAQRGIIAHTVSSYGLHKDYHHPSDEISTIDFNHMTNAIESMVGPIRWLARNDFKPAWNPNGRPAPPAANSSAPSEASKP